MHLLDRQALERSSVVANCAMNRERGLTGSNGYGRELDVDIVAFLHDRLLRGPVRWADLCCGTGRALIEAAAELTRNGLGENLRIDGVDLAGLFDHTSLPAIVTLRKQSIEDWVPTGRYDLITCVHGFHYVGDKLAAIAKAAGCLAPGGLLVANLDVASFRNPDGTSAGRLVAARLRGNGFTYNARRRLIRCEGPQRTDFALRYLGADDTTGPNYTGQPAVASYYVRA